MRITQVGRVSQDARDYVYWQMDIVLDDGQSFDYRHERTNRAVLPTVAFRELFLPTPEDEPVLIDGFAAVGR